MAIQFAQSGWKDGWYVVPYSIPWRDLDAAGHVNNAVFFTYFEWGRTRFWLDMNGATSPRDIDFIVARADCNFRGQLGMEDILIGTRIGRIGRSSFDFVSEIRRASGGELAADGTVVAVSFDWESNSKKEISGEFREKLARFQKE